MVAPADLNQYHIESVLKENKASDSLIGSFSELIKTCQRALYASTAAENMSTVYEQAVNLISELEDK